MSWLRKAITLMVLAQPEASLIKASGGAPRTVRGITLDPRFQFIEAQSRKRGTDWNSMTPELMRAQEKAFSKIGGGARVPGIYSAEAGAGSNLLVPRPSGGAPEVVRKRLLTGFAKSFFPEKIVVPSLRVVFDRVAVEAARGCPQNCRFCQASSLYFPHRTKDPGLLYRTALRSLRQTGYEDASLTALSVGDYPHLEETVRCLMDDLTREKISLSLSSLRPRGLSQELVRNILKVRKTGFSPSSRRRGRSASAR